MYYSYSSTTEKIKFRVVLVCSEIVTDPKEHHAIYQGIYSLFPKTEITNKAGRRVTKAQIDLSCCNLDRYFYGTSKGIVDGCRGVKLFDKAVAVKMFTDTMQAKPAGTTTSQPERVNMSKTPEQWQAHNKAAGVGFDLGQAIREFNLLDYITSTTGRNPSRGGGKDVRIDPCPICDKNARFQVDTQKNVFQCFGDSCGAVGNIVNYLMYTRGLDKKAARECFKYEHCGIDPEAEKQEFAMKKQAERQQATNTPLPAPQPEAPKTAAERLAQSGLIIRAAEEIEEKPVEYTLYPHLPKHALVVLVGIQGAGKSWLTLEMAAAVANGTPWVGEEIDPEYSTFKHTRKKQNVLIFAAEDDAERTMAKRLRQSVPKEQQKGIYIIEAQSGLHIPMNSQMVKDAIEAYNPGAVFFDPVQSFLPEGTDQNNAADMRRILTDTLAIARERGITIICIQHMNKDETKSAVYRGMGSNEYNATARVGLFLGADPNDETGERKILAFSKANWLAPSLQKSLAYHVDTRQSKAVVWEGISPLKIDDISSVRRKSKGAGEGDRESVERKIPLKERARDFIEERIQEAGGVAVAADIKKAWRSFGFKDGSLYEGLKMAKDYIAITPNGAGLTVYWYDTDFYDS